MGKKEASKGREWEKGRRDVLNQTFNELHQALPNYVVGQTLSKKTILIQALSCIRELQQSKNQDADDDLLLKLENLKKWVQDILSKLHHFLAFLDTINVKVPADCLAIDTPPPGTGVDTSQVLNKLEKLRLTTNNSSKDEIKSHGEQDTEEKKKHDSLFSVPSSSGCTESNSNKTVHSNNQCGKVSKGENLLVDSSENLLANPSIIQSRPLVVQSSSLQMPSQLLFTSNSSNSPITSSLPLLVSVTGVKTVNPFILVQSNIMAPNPSVHQKVVRPGTGRPIQPCPSGKISRRNTKVPIPSLKQKLFHNGFSQSTSLKSLKKNFGKDSSKPSHETKSGKSVRKKKILKGKQPSSSINVTNVLVMSKVKKQFTGELRIPDKIAVKEVDEKAIGCVPEIDKENIVKCGLSTEADVDGSKENSFIQRETSIPANNQNVKENDVREHSVSLCITESQLENQEENSVSTVTETLNIVKKRPYESENSFNKPQDCKKKVSQEKPSLENGESHPVKMSKSNYSISALCARQQLLQTPENNLLEGAPLEIPCSNNCEAEKIKLGGSPNIDNNSVPVETPSNKLNDNSSILKGKVTLPAATDSCNEWAEKFKMKPDRPSTSFNILSSLPLHNSKNTFIPINEIENFKAVPETFDSHDTSFGLPLQSNDISNDLFASLQVPTSGQHPESISPTAAFLLAFPLVSTSKATELDETVCENTDSQPGMKTILQIGNLDCDTPVTKCVSVFSSNENNSVVYSSSNVFSQDTSTVTAHKSRNSTQLNFPSREEPQKTSTENMVSLKETSNFMQKCSETLLSVKEAIVFSPKENYQPSCLSSNKRICSSRADSSATPSVSNFNGQLSGTRISNKNGMLLQGGGLNKNSQKLIQSLENTTTSTFLSCDKQTDWHEMPQAPVAIFPDYPPVNTSRSDCAVNYVLPPVLMSSSTGGEELSVVPKSQVPSSLPANILSWSTLAPTGNNQLSVSTPKCANFQEICPSTKITNKAVEFQHSLANQDTSVNQTELVVASVSTIGNKLSSILPNYAEVVPTSSENESLLTGRQTSHSHNYVTSGNNLGARKSFLALPGTSSSEVLKMSSTSCGSITHQQTRISQTSSAKVTCLPSEDKSSKENNVYFNERVSSQSIKMGMSSGLGNTSKDSRSTLYNQNNIVNGTSEVKQLHSTYSQIPTLNVKGSVGPNSIGNSYNHETNSQPKENGVLGTNYSSGMADSKKDVLSFTQNSEATIEVLKQSTSSLHYIQENVSMSQFGNLPTSQHESFNIKPNHHNGQEIKSQTGQQRQLCVRSSNKESTTNLHRPPVNWMTAPDIRSHQHHSGPSFGNSSNLNSTQGLLYLPEHIKESENSGSVFDQTTNFHCLDMAHSSQPLYKANDHHLFGNDSIENFHDNSAWSPSKNGGTSMLGNMMIPSTLPTLVGDLALGDNNISRPFLPSFNNDTQGCLKKSARRGINTQRRLDKSIDETNVTSATIGSQECAGSFLSVSQLVDNSNPVKSRNSSLSKENNLSYTGSFTDHDTSSCQTTKQSSSKSISSNYSTEALLSSTIPLQTNQPTIRKRRTHGSHLSNNYVGTSMPYQNTGSVTLQVQGSQNQYLPDLSRTNDYQGTFIPSDTVPPFILGNPSSRPHRNHSYSLQNVTERTAVEDNVVKPHLTGGVLDNTTVRPRTNNHSSASNGTSIAAVTSSASNVMDFGYMNMTTTVLQDDINYTNHPPPPSFLPHHSYSMQAGQDSLYSTPRLAMHPTHHPQNSNIQSPSATTLTNFHLSTIFPEINDKVIC